MSPIVLPPQIPNRTQPHMLYPSFLAATSPQLQAASSNYFNSSPYNRKLQVLEAQTRSCEGFHGMQGVSFSPTSMAPRIGRPLIEPEIPPKDHFRQNLTNQWHVIVIYTEQMKDLHRNQPSRYKSWLKLYFRAQMYYQLEKFYQESNCEMEDSSADFYHIALLGYENFLRPDPNINHLDLHTLHIYITIELLGPLLKCALAHKSEDTSKIVQVTREFVHNLRMSGGRPFCDYLDEMCAPPREMIDQKHWTMAQLERVNFFSRLTSIYPQPKLILKFFPGITERSLREKLHPKVRRTPTLKMNRSTRMRDNWDHNNIAMRKSFPRVNKSLEIREALKNLPNGCGSLNEVEAELINRGRHYTRDVISQTLSSLQRHGKVIKTARKSGKCQEYKISPTATTRQYNNSRSAYAHPEIPLTKIKQEMLQEMAWSANGGIPPPPAMKFAKPPPPPEPVTTWSTLKKLHNPPSPNFNMKIEPRSPNGLPLLPTEPSEALPPLTPSLPQVNLLNSLHPIEPSDTLPPLTPSLPKANILNPIDIAVGGTSTANKFIPTSNIQAEEEETQKSDSMLSETADKVDLSTIRPVGSSANLTKLTSWPSLHTEVIKKSDLAENPTESTTLISSRSKPSALEAKTLVVRETKSLTFEEKPDREAGDEVVNAKVKSDLEDVTQAPALWTEQQGTEHK